MNRIKKVNGGAAIMAALCNPSKPPLINITQDTAAINKHQMVMTLLLGLRLPLEVRTPKTKVAELAEVMKKIVVNSNAKKLSTTPKGSVSKNRKSPASGSD